MILKARNGTALKVLALLGVGLAALPAQAVSLAADGLGQVLIYPYYSVRGGNDTHLSVLNQTDQPKVLSVRLRESRNGREVSSLTLFLGPRDEWVAGITATADGAKLYSGDASCTRPVIAAGGMALTNLFIGGGAHSSGFDDSGQDGDGSSPDRTREGYIEVIELGVIDDPLLALQVTVQGLQAPCRLTGEPIPRLTGSRALAPPSGGLAGSASLINVGQGSEYSYEPVVLDDFSQINLWTGDRLPDLGAANPPISQVTFQGESLTSTWAEGIDAVSAVLMRVSLLNQVVLEPTTLSQTSWVVTFPTKHHYVPVGRQGPKPRGPFSSIFGEGGACEAVYQGIGVNFPLNDREGVPVVDPRPNPGPDLKWPMLCREATVLAFNGSTLLTSPVAESLVASYDNGWTQLDFDNEVHSLRSLEGHVYRGLPVTGFMLRNFVNGNLNGVLSNYGGSYNHKYLRSIQRN
ncbi:MAG: hypothetical protein ABWY06_23130 [Pseudomonas sp.]|uniref:hypothetical protein n=1 Tax=Pseudomonas sp. TaxID=306 RepID=UPI00339310F7